MARGTFIASTQVIALSLCFFTAVTTQVIRGLNIPSTEVESREDFQEAR